MSSKEAPIVVEEEFPLEPLPEFPPGYRFNPRDDELIEHFLMNQVSGKELPSNFVTKANLYLYDPATLVEKYKSRGENSWYFLTPRTRKHVGGSMPDRTAGDPGGDEGFWKASGAATTIKNADGKEIGQRASLRYMKGNNKDETKTDWMMTEYCIPESNQPIDPEGKSNLLDTWVLCKIYKKMRHMQDNEDNSKGNDVVSVPSDMDKKVPEHKKKRKIYSSNSLIHK